MNCLSLKPEARKPAPPASLSPPVALTPDGVPLILKLSSNILMPLALCADFLRLSLTDLPLEFDTHLFEFSSGVTIAIKMLLGRLKRIQVVEFFKGFPLKDGRSPLAGHIVEMLVSGH